MRSRPLAALASVILAGLGLCAVLVVVGASGVRAEASQEEKQGRTEATKEQGHSGGAAPEGHRCDRTRTIVRIGGTYLTNDLPGCPNKGGLLSVQLPKNYGLMGEKGDDELRGHGEYDEIYGGAGSDVLYGGSESPPEGDFVWGDEGDDVIYGGDGNDYGFGGDGADVIYGGDGNDNLGESGDGQRDKLYCGKGKDQYQAEKIDYVDSSCEEGKLADTGGPPLILLAGAALCSALIMIRYVIRYA